MMETNDLPKPSPSHVGQEFVRQYYTLLNKAPNFIHKFYGANSSYVRGETYKAGESEKPAIGQENIKLKIDSLDFQDCRTKIRQVDAYATIGNSVVVQVAGEISNKELPLRRFMQTFVLAPQGDNPCKFYVHNDIFRYQDDVFVDEPSVTDQSDLDPEEEAEAIDDCRSSITDKVLSVEKMVLECCQEPQSVVVVNMQHANGVEQHEEEEVSEKNTSIASVEQAASVTQHSTETPPTPEPAAEEQVEATQPPAPASPQQPPQSQQTPAAPEPPVEEAPAVPEVREQPTFKTFSWADITSKNTNKPATVPSPVHFSKPAPAPVAQAAAPVAESTESVEANTQSRPNRGVRPSNGGRSQGGGYVRDDERVNDSYNRRMQPGNTPLPPRYPDNQQIFVGNLSPEITDQDLKNHFEEFGTVVDVRINYSHHNPNFGFVIFEEPSSVQEVLRVLPNQMRNVRINIEEKKQRRNERRNNGSGDYQRRQGGGNGMNMRNRNNNNGGVGGGGNMMRRDNRQHSRDGAPVRQQQQQQGYSNNGPRR